MNKAALADRRAELVERCAEQRVNLAIDLHAFTAPPLAMHPLASQLLARLLANKRMVLGVAGTVLGIALARPGRILRAAGLLASGWRLAQRGMALAARYRR